MEKTVTLEGTKLKQIADRNDTATLVMMSLADRKRFRSVTDIGHMKNLLVRSGEKVVLEDYMKTWKELEAAGVGSIIYGRNGQSNRFKWNYSLTAVGHAAMNGKDIQVKNLRYIPVTKIVTHKLPAPKKVEAPKPIPVVSQNILYIPLRSDFIIDLKIPSDVTEQELNAIRRALERFA